MFMAVMVVEIAIRIFTIRSITCFTLFGSMFCFIVFGVYKFTSVQVYELVKRFFEKFRS